MTSFKNQALLQCSTVNLEQKGMTMSNKRKELEIRIQELEDLVGRQNQIILDLQIKLQSNMIGRKSQVLELLNKYSSISILEMSNELNISTKNISSQLTYLRTDGYLIFTDNNGRKVLMNKTVSNEKRKEVEKAVAMSYNQE